MTKGNIRTNKYAQHCWRCGGLVPAGKGRLFYVQPDDEGLFGYQSGWLVEHLSIDECNKNIKEYQDKEAERKAKEAALQQERDEFAAKIKDQGLKECVDWSWDDDRFSLGKVIAETDHFEAREYLAWEDGGYNKLLGFVIKQKK